MADLDVPECVEELYDSVGDEVSLGRPIFQGDVFDSVVMPGLSEEPGRVMVLSHPCSMRGAGGRLKTYVTVAAVYERDAIPLRKLSNSHYAIFVLPGLPGADPPIGMPYVDFSRISSLRSNLLDRRNRVAALSEYGVQLLQQRQVFHFTRVKINLATIWRQLAPNFTEIELAQEWIESFVDVESGDLDLVARICAAEEDFDGFLNESNRERRHRLRDETRRSGVRIDVRNEIRRRLASISCGGA